MTAARIYRHRLGLTWLEPGGTGRTSHAVRTLDGVWLIDPFEDIDALAAADGLGPALGVVQLLDRHNRDCAAIAARLGVTHLKVPSHVPGSPFEVVPVISNRLWKEVALWWPEERCLIVAEAVGTAPAFAVGRRAGVHPMLRAKPPRGQLSAFRPELLLVGHGPPVETGGGAALLEALENARSDGPKFIASLPKLIAGGR